MYFFFGTYTCESKSRTQAYSETTTSCEMFVCVCVYVRGTEKGPKRQREVKLIFRNCMCGCVCARGPLAEVCLMHLTVFIPRNPENGFSGYIIFINIRDKLQKIVS